MLKFEETAKRGTYRFAHKPVLDSRRRSGRDRGHWGWRWHRLGRRYSWWCMRSSTVGRLMGRCTVSLLQTARIIATVNAWVDEEDTQLRDSPEISQNRAEICKVFLQRESALFYNNITLCNSIRSSILA